MKIIDANVILRYLLKDNIKLFHKTEDFIENNVFFLPTEIFAEVVYVLEKVYKIEKAEIKKTLLFLCNYKNIKFSDLNILIESISLYEEFNMDFADSLLAAYKKVNKSEIFTFDKKFNSILNRIKPL